MLNTIILVIITLCGATSILHIIDTIDGKRKFDIRDIIIVVVAILAVISANLTNDATYDRGYNDAIEDAILWEADEYKYTIDFNGELHTYSNYYHE